MNRFSFPLVLVVFLLAQALPVVCQIAGTKESGTKSASASEAEVQQLRDEVAAQRQTIDELKARRSSVPGFLLYAAIAFVLRARAPRLDRFFCLRADCDIS